MEDADHFDPQATGRHALRNYIDPKLNFRTNSTPSSSFRIRYRGKGNSFFMVFDDLKIERNKFEDSVKFGKGLYLSGTDYLQIPISNITLSKGTVEFWLKLTTDTYGIDRFGDMNSRTLFSLINNNNEIVSLSIKSGKWFHPAAGQTRKQLILFETSGLPFREYRDIGEVLHMAIVWDNSGKYTDNGDTLKLYINGELLAFSKLQWNVTDSKFVTFKLGGAAAQLDNNYDVFTSAVFDNLKIYNYCKTTFDINTQGITESTTYTPNQFMEISKDNLNFYGLGSGQLPLVFEAVPNGEKRRKLTRT
jgi:hypothetical protein